MIGTRSARVVGCLLLVVLLMGAEVSGLVCLATPALAAEEELMADWSLSRLRLNAFRDTQLKRVITSLHPASDPLFRENQLALKAHQMILPGRVLTLGDASGNYRVNYAGKKEVFYSAAGKTQAVALMSSETFPQKTTLYAYPTGLLKTISLRFSPKDTFVFTADGELAESPKPTRVQGLQARAVTRKYISDDAQDQHDEDAEDADFSNQPDNRLWHRATYQRKVVEIGQKILKANHIQQSISFSVANVGQTVNAYGSASYNSVVVTTELLKYISSDDELAGVLGHEIGHILLNHRVKHTSNYGYRYAGMVFQGQPEIKHDQLQSQELDADARGVQLAMKAGYNPWGQYTALQKILNDTDGDALGKSTHPQGSLRLKILAQQIKRLQRQGELTASTLAPPASLMMATVSKPAPFAAGSPIRLGPWDEAAARDEVLKQTALTNSLKQEVVHLPTLDPDLALHLNVIQGKASAADRVLHYHQFMGPYAELMKDTQQGATGYSVFFPQVKAYPSYKMDGHLQRFSLCNQAQYPRSCYTVNVTDQRLLGMWFEVTETSGFGFDGQGKLLNYTVDSQTYNMQQQQISAFKRFPAPSP